MAPGHKKYQFDDDYFKDTTMSFGEHLEELRKRLILALLGLGVGLGFGLYFANDFVQLIQTPVRKALIKYTKEEAQDRIKKLDIEDEYPGASALVEQGYYFEPSYLDVAAVIEAIDLEYPNLATPRISLFAARDLKEPEQLCRQLAAVDESPVASHFASLLAPDDLDRVRVWATQDALSPVEQGALVEMLDDLVRDRSLYEAAAFKKVALSAESDLLVEKSKKESLTAPQRERLNRLLLTDAFPKAIAAPVAKLTQIMIWKPQANHPRTTTRSLGVTEPFMIFIKAMFVVGLLISGPWIFLQIWLFVAAGLYPHEKNYVYLYGPISLGLFALGVLLAFVLVFAPVLNFLFSMNRMMGIEIDLRINEWVGFVMMLPLGFGISFQLPLVMLFLQRIGIFTTEQYIENWRIAVMVICVLSAILTPADPWSMLYMAAPLTILYWGGLALCKFLPRSEDDEELAGT